MSWLSCSRARGGHAHRIVKRGGMGSPTRTNCIPLYDVCDATLKKEEIQKDGVYEMIYKDKPGYVADAMFAILFAGFGYLFGGTAFRKNLTRLHTIIKKH